MTILDKPLNKGTQAVSLSAFSFVIAEAIQYLQERISNVSDLERKLEDLGHSVGWRMLDLIVARKRPGQRDTKILGMLHFVSSTCWKVLFGHAADTLERSTQKEDEYHIHDKDPITNKYISVPKDMGRLNCAAFIAGIVRGLLCAGGFPATVTAHIVQQPTVRTVYLIKFDASVMEKEK